MPKFKIAILAAALIVAALPAGASEPVPTTQIIGELIPITGHEGERSIDLDITFKFGSAALTASAKSQLDALGQALISPQLEGARIGIYGHTDASGPADVNQKLSEKRAASVRIYLVETFGIDPDRLVAAGYGETKLKNTANPNAAENRRVEIVNLSTVPSKAVANPAHETKPAAAQPMAGPAMAGPHAPTAPTAPTAPMAPPEGGGMQSIQ